MEARRTVIGKYIKESRLDEKVAGRKKKGRVWVMNNRLQLSNNPQ